MKNNKKYIGELRYPIFCFRNLHRNYDMDCCARSDSRFPKALLKKLAELSKLTWDDLKMTHVGTEKVEINSMKVGLPAGVPNQLSSLLAFNFSGTKGRILGHQNGNIFHVYYVDTDLSTYDHG